MDGHQTLSQWVGNVVGASAIVGTLLGWLPAVGAVVAIIWYIIQIKESRTYREWHARRRTLRIARLKARLLLLESKPLPLPPEIEDKL